MITGHRMRRNVGAASAVLLVALTLAASAASANAVPPVPSTPVDRGADSMTADALPTVQIDNGVVWDQAIVGNTVYAGGEFSQTRPAGAAKGQNLTARSNLLAYDITTGDLLPFDVPVNGAVKRVVASPDGKTLYIGGSFTRVGGKARSNIAAIDLATGTVSDSFQGAIGGSFVNALAVTSTDVYVGGLFTRAGGKARANLAAFTTSGALTSWSPTADRQVDDMIVAPRGDRLVVAGRFGTINGAASPGTAALDVRTGASLPWALNASRAAGVVDGGSFDSGTMGLSTDGTVVYGACWAGLADATSNCQGNWAADANTGALVWMTGGEGDDYDAYVSGSTVYAVGHSHEAHEFGGWPSYNTPGGSYQFSLALTARAMGTNTTGGHWDNSGKAAPAIVQWYPSWITGTYTGMGQAGWTTEGNGKYLAVGGEFLGVNGQAQQGLVRFANNAAAPQKKQGPKLSADAATGRAWEKPTFTARPGGAVVAIRPNYDRDDRTLTYQLLRSGTKEPVASTTYSSDPWLRATQTVSLSDYTGTPGTTYTYTVRALDGDGNHAESTPVTGTTGTGHPPTMTAYASTVIADGPSLYYLLGGGSRAALDIVGANDGTVGSGVSDASGAAVLADQGTGSAFDGTSYARIGTEEAVPAPSSLSTEVWFRTTTTRGGKLTGYGSSQTGTSSSYDRHLYMDDEGRVLFGVYAGKREVVGTTKAYNDGNWHHVVATLSPTTGTELYIDGKLAGSDPSVTTSTNTENGYWRLGGDNLDGWPSGPNSAYFAGDLDEFAVYPYALSAEQIAGHYAAGKDETLIPPKAGFTAHTSGLRVMVDATDSWSHKPKTIASYVWDFGDGTGATGVSASHTYPTTGKYTVRLTVTDSAAVAASRASTVTARVGYPATVLTDRPSLYYRLGGNGSHAAHDLAGSNDGVLGSGVSTSPIAAIPSDPDGATRFDGTKGARIGTSKAVPAPEEFSTEVWFNTTTTRGAKLTGFSGMRLGAPSSYDRQVFMDDRGRVGFGVDSDGHRTVRSAKAYNDGTWHQAVATLGDDGMRLYVDGKLVGSDASGSSTDGDDGYWRVGGDDLADWPDGSTHFAGDLAQFAVYPKALTTAQVAAHYEAGVAGDGAGSAGSGPRSIATDGFSRSGTSWDTADAGGPWSNAKGLSVSGGRGVITLSKAGQTVGSYLTSTRATNVDMTMDVSMDKLSTGGSTFAWAVARHTSAGDYRVKLVQNTNQTMSVTLVAQTGSRQAVLGTAVMKDYHYKAGAVVKLRFMVTSDGAASELEAKAWPSDAAEPPSWTVTATDSTASLQKPGQLGVAGYLGSAATTMPQTLRIDNFTSIAP